MSEEFRLQYGGCFHLSNVHKYLRAINPRSLKFLPAQFWNPLVQSKLHPDYGTLFSLVQNSLNFILTVSVWPFLNFFCFFLFRAKFPALQTKKIKNSRIGPQIEPQSINLQNLKFQKFRTFWKPA